VTRLAKSTRLSSPAADAGRYAPGCTCFYLRSATRRITQIYDEVLKAAGLSVNQYSLLSMLARHGGVTLSGFAEIMSMDRTTLSRNLQPLEAAGWVESGAGGRSRLLALTEAGRAKVKAALPLWHEAQGQVNELLGPERQRALHRVLRDSIRSVETCRPPSGLQA
jgi:DNA-binding MarR family transcriptional regulator